MVTRATKVNKMAEVACMVVLQVTVQVGGVIPARMEIGIGVKVMEQSVVKVRGKLT